MSRTVRKVATFLNLLVSWYIFHFDLLMKSIKTCCVKLQGGASGKSHIVLAPTAPRGGVAGAIGGNGDVPATRLLCSLQMYAGFSQ